MREGPVTLLNAFLTSSKARGEQLDNLRRLLMVESIGKIHVWATGHDILLRVRRTDKSFSDVWGQWTVQLISGCHVKAWNFSLTALADANMLPSCSDRDFGQKRAV
jgi:hypothetical protein